jgi:hypothetical protein
VQEHTRPTGDACSKVGIDIVSTPPLLVQVLVAALKDVPKDLAENEAVALDAERLNCLQVLLQGIEIYAVACCIALYVLPTQGIDT